MVQGIMLNIDNNMLTACQAAADEAMIKVCGSTEDCNGLAVDEGIGSRSLEYKFCTYSLSTNNTLSINYDNCRPELAQITDDELAGSVVNASTGQRSGGLAIAATITGMIYWDTLDSGSDELMNADEYIAKLEQVLSLSFSEGEKADIRRKVSTEVRSLQQSINTAINAIEADPTVQYCMSGRQVQGMKNMKIGRGGAENARFPELTKQMRIIISSYAIKAAKSNYYVKYDELNKKMLEDYAKAGERLAGIYKEDKLNVRREYARQACISFADASILATSPNPPKNGIGQIIDKVVKTASAVAMTIGTAGAAQGISGVMGTVNGLSKAAGTLANAQKIVGSVGSAVSSAKMLVGGAAASGGFDQSGGGNGSVNNAYVNGNNSDMPLLGSKQLNQWNFKQTITSTFEWETLACEKCTTSQNCAATKNPLFGSSYCKSWADEKKECSTTQF
jgi:hypothetical protein